MIYGPVSASFIFLWSWVVKKGPKHAKPLTDSYLTGTMRREICWSECPTDQKKNSLQLAFTKKSAVKIPQVQICKSQTVEAKPGTHKCCNSLDQHFFQVDKRIYIR